LVSIPPTYKSIGAKEYSFFSQLLEYKKKERRKKEKRTD
jgi:hypothetical protein